MTDKERIAKLEERLANAEARIAQLERQPAPVPIDLFRFGPLPTVGDPTSIPPDLGVPKVWCGSVQREGYGLG